MDQENNKLNETKAEEIVNSEEVKEVATGETETPEITPQNQTTLNFVNDNPPPKKKKKFLIPIIIGVVLVVLVAVFFILTSTHVICLEHEWNNATCTEPKTCEYCGKTDGEAKGHEWVGATCLTPKTCSRCDKTEGESVGHIEGKWTITQEATLVKEGKEEMLCVACKESIQTRTISKKVAKVIGKSFNFTDEEFIEWLKSFATVTVGSEQDVDSKMNTGYFITTAKGETGILLLNHGDNGLSGNICGLMVYFDDYNTSILLLSMIGEKIDSKFEVGEAYYSVLANDQYTKAAMTLLYLEGEEIALLTTSENLASIL